MDIWSICFALSIAVIIITIVLFIFRKKVTSLLGLGDLTTYGILYGGVFVSIYILIFPFIDDDVIQHLAINFYNSLRVFTGDFDYDAEIIANSGETLSRYYSFILSALYVIAPILTISFIIQIFKSFVAKLNYKFNKDKQAYIISILDERTLITGQEIKKNNQDNLVIYMNPDPDTENNDYLRHEAAEIGALVIDDDIKNFNIGKRDADISILLAKKKDLDNITDFMELVKDHRFSKLSDDFLNTVYIFSSTEEYENVINSFLDDNAKEIETLRVITIDELHNVIYNLFYNYPLYTNLEKHESIQLLVIGNSPLSKEVVRIATWCGQMQNHDLSIDYFCTDKDIVKAEFDFLYPELSKSCKVNFHELKNPDTIRDIENYNPSYIVVAMDDEMQNLKMAIELSTLYKRKELEEDSIIPQICFWNPGSNLDKELSELKDNKNNPYNLRPFGGLNEQYNSENIFNSSLDQLGYKVHEYYTKLYEPDKDEKEIKKDYYKSEYNRKSSVAAALHNKYKLEDLRLLGKETDSKSDLAKTFEDLEFKNLMLRLEHRRWSAYFRANGYKQITPEDLKKYIESGKLIKHVSEPLKLHACLAVWDDDKGNPLADNNIKYEDLSEEEINYWLKTREDLDELDRMTLTAWLIAKNAEKRAAKNNEEVAIDINSLKKDFKLNDEGIIQILYS